MAIIRRVKIKLWNTLADLLKILLRQDCTLRECILVRGLFLPKRAREGDCVVVKTKNTEVIRPMPRLQAQSDFALFPERNHAK